MGPYSVAVRTHEIALGDLCFNPLPSKPVGYCGPNVEFLELWITMIKVHHVRRKSLLAVTTRLVFDLLYLLRCATSALESVLTKLLLVLLVVPLMVLPKTLLTPRGQAILDSRSLPEVLLGLTPAAMSTGLHDSQFY